MGWEEKGGRGAGGAPGGARVTREVSTVKKHFFFFFLAYVFSLPGPPLSSRHPRPPGRSPYAHMLISRPPGRMRRNIKVRPEGGVASRRRPCGRGGDLYAKRQARREGGGGGADKKRGPASAIFMGLQRAPGLSTHASKERRQPSIALVEAR